MNTQKIKGWKEGEELVKGKREMRKSGGGGGPRSGLWGVYPSAQMR